MKSNHFDYIIVGHGLAGLQLALAITEDLFFADKTIALIDPDTKKVNDKTWCFWETQDGPFQHLVSNTWNTANFYTNDTSLSLQLKPYQYKLIKSLDFYNDCIEKLKKTKQCTFIKESVNSINKLTVNTDSESYTCTHIFDSRIDEEFKKDTLSTKLIQHFKGWVIETNTPQFQPESFTIMDYRVMDNNLTAFHYVLPFSETKALIEFTYFTPHTVEANHYDTFLEDYIKNTLHIKEYEIKEVEIGKIPMSNFPFYKASNKNLTKIGTAGGWVKPSSGYSFTLTQKRVKQVLQNIKEDKIPSFKLSKAKYRFYDKVFLKVLNDENSKGEWIFKRYYSKNKIETMFRFLDEESSLKEDLQIMWSLFSFSFIKAFFKTL